MKALSRASSTGKWGCCRGEVVQGYRDGVKASSTGKWGSCKRDSSIGK